MKGYKINRDYEVKYDGRVISHRFGRKKEMRQSIDFWGYCCVNLSINKEVKRFRVHRLVAEHFIGKQPSPSHQICHIDGNTKNNWAHNLKWGTAKENAADRERHGRTSRGEKHGIATQSGRRKKRLDKMFLRQNECDEIIRILLVEFPGLISGDDVDAEGVLEELRHQIKSSPQIKREYDASDWGK